MAIPPPILVIGFAALATYLAHLVTIHRRKAASMVITMTVTVIISPVVVLIIPPVVSPVIPVLI